VEEWTCTPSQVLAARLVHARECCARARSSTSSRSILLFCARRADLRRGPQRVEVTRREGGHEHLVHPEDLDADDAARRVARRTPHRRSVPSLPARPRPSRSPSSRARLPALAGMLEVRIHLGSNLDPVEQTLTLARRDARGRHPAAAARACVAFAPITCPARSTAPVSRPSSIVQATRGRVAPCLADLS